MSTAACMQETIFASSNMNIDIDKTRALLQDPNDKAMLQYLVGGRIVEGEPGCFVAIDEDRQQIAFTGEQRQRIEEALGEDLQESITPLAPPLRVLGLSEDLTSKLRFWLAVGDVCLSEAELTPLQVYAYEVAEGVTSEDRRRVKALLNAAAASALAPHRPRASP